MNTTRTTSPTARAGDFVYAQLKGQLLEGELHPGERIEVEPLKQQFGVSKQPIMEALRKLSGEGFVEIMPQVGCRVTTYSPQEIEDFFRVFAAAEGVVAELAVQRRTPAQLDALRQISDQIGTFAAMPVSGIERSTAYRTLNRTFHRTIHEMVEAPVVLGINSTLWDRSDFFINTLDPNLPFDESFDARHADHEQLIAALEQRDASRARAVMQTHILRNIDLIRERR